MGRNALNEIAGEDAMLYVYVTPQCLQDAATINTHADIEALKEKLTYEQSTLGLERHPRPFLKKRIGRTRVVMAEVHDGEDIVLCFLRHVYKKDIGDYETFFKTLQIPSRADSLFASFLEESRSKPIVIKDPPTDLELEYLLLDRNQEMGGITVLESPLWISGIRTLRDTQGKQGLLTPIWEILEEVCDDRTDGWETRCEKQHDRHDVHVVYRHFPESNQLFLIAAIETAAGEDCPVRLQANTLLQKSANFENEQLLRNAARAYPDFILYDREIWESTQASLEANLALSPEEGDVLAHVLDPGREGGFPLFINGRPGSGKSTILQYLFAEYLHAHLARREDTRLSYPPLYLTYNERLLDNARKLVEDIFRCGAEKLAANESVDLGEADQRKEFNRAFVYFREFLSKLAGETRFRPSNYVDYHRFCDLYAGNSSYGPDAKLRRLAPEVAWHILRTYIKGKNAGESQYFDPDSYAELPREEISVTPETFELVWDKVWNGWYRSLCEQEGYWDDQDLARFVLDHDLVPAKYPAVFCDESQDFTSIELELIFRLSRYSTKRIESFYLTKVPYAFAGDPFQTLNPTGFRWDAIKANFHDNIVRQLAPDAHGKVDFTFKELAYNYRSTASIVRFCNLVQLKRAELFQIPNVKPQQAWTLDKGAWPAYFKLDLGTEARLKEQSELVILVPCQEGEELSFVKNDDFLRRVALDENGEVSRSVLSPMRAKGLEFGRVVLYKFGSQALKDGHVDLIESTDVKNVGAMEREKTLGLEYFFNGLYVAASRAQRRLLVIDSADGIQKFWDFATDPVEIGLLLSDRRRSNWSENDVHHMLHGDTDTWTEERDDPRAVADRLFHQGRLDQSVYLLQLARNQYSILNEAEREELCNALIHDFKGEHRAAAEAYQRLGELPEAIRCFWQAKAFDKVSEIAAKDSGRFGYSPLAIAARFKSGIASGERAAQFVRELAQTSPERRIKHFRVDHWPDIMQTAIVALNQEGSNTGVVAADIASEAFRSLTKMRQAEGLVLENTPELAYLAFSAGEPFTALEIWKDIKGKPSIKEPAFILQARAITTPYPQNLFWYGQLNYHDTIISEFKARSDVELDSELREIVVKAFLAKEDWPAAVDVLKRGASWSVMRKFLTGYPQSRATSDSLLLLLGAFIKAGLEKGEFRQVIDDFKPGRTSISAVATLLEDEGVLLRCEATLIRLLSRSDRLLNEKQDDKFVSGTVFNIAKKHAAELREFVSPEEVGAALERAGRMDNALMFYEQVFKGKGWHAERGRQDHAKARWLKCKQRQADLFEKDDRKKSQRSAEAKRMSAEWGIQVPDEEYPTLPSLASDEIELLFNAPVESPGAAKPDRLPKDKEHLEPEDIPLEGGDQTKTISHEIVSWFPTQYDPFEGRIELSCDCGNVDLRMLLLPKKRRLEMRDESNDDLVMVRVAELEIDSNDLKVTGGDSTVWSIGAWALNINLIDVALGTILVDITDHDGRRILCLAL